MLGGLVLGGLVLGGGGGLCLIERRLMLLLDRLYVLRGAQRRVALSRELSVLCLLALRGPLSVLQGLHSLFRRGGRSGAPGVDFGEFAQRLCDLVHPVRRGGDDDHGVVAGQRT